MELSLARWDDEDGETAGYWLIRQLPGFVIEHFDSGWITTCSDDYIRGQGPSSDRVWGENWVPCYGLYTAIPAKDLGPHNTRGEALHAIEQHVGKPTAPVIAEMIS